MQPKAIVTLAIFLTLVFLTACGSQPTAVPTPTEAPPVPTSTAVPAPTNTPEPAPPVAPLDAAAADFLTASPASQDAESVESESVTDVDSDSTVVPSGTQPTINGTLSPGEWDEALVETLSDGSELLLMHADDYLYLGVRPNTPEMTGANIYIEDNGQIMILHTSAALGTAIYQQGVDGWQQTQAFDWQCRDRSDSASAQAKRTAYLQENHWLAANSRMGAPNELEYQIEVTDGSQRIAVSVFRSSTPDERAFWPATLDDDTIQPNPGGLPTELHFSPDQWEMLNPEPIGN